MRGETGFSLSDLRNHPGFTFVIATHTDEKPFNFSVIGDYFTQNYGFPLAIFPLVHFRPHSAPLEDGKSSAANAIIKRAAAEEGRITLSNPDTKEHRALVKGASRHGVAFHQHTTILFSEDSIQGIPLSLAPLFLKKLVSAGANPDLLKNTRTHNHKDIDYLMLVDYGIIKNAIGTYAFYDLLRQTAHESGYKNFDSVPLIDDVSCSWMRLDEEKKMQDREPVKAITEVFLYAPDGLDKPLRKPDKESIYPKQLLCTSVRPDEPISNYFFDYLRHESFRAVVFQKLLIDIARDSQPIPISKNFVKARKALAHRPAAQDVLVVQVTPGKAPAIFKGTQLKRYIPTSFDEAAGLLSLEFPSYAAPQPRTADIIVVPPHKPESFEGRLIHAVMINSMKTARQIDPRYGRQTSFIINNLKGCLNRTLRASRRLDDAGLVGNYPRCLHNESPTGRKIIDIAGVTLKSDQYFHELRSDDEDALNKANRILVRHLSENIIRSPHQAAPDYFYPENIEKPEGMFTGVGFMSANHENLGSVQVAADLSSMLARKDMAAGWGGMNKLPGKQFMESYLANGGQYLFASSTHDLEQMETVAGLDSRIHHRILRRTIAPRAIDLIGFADILYSLYGGVGTVVEDGMGILSDKPLIFIDPMLTGIKQSPWKSSPKGEEMRYLLGEDLTNLMAYSHDALSGKGIFLATSVDEAEDFTNEILNRPSVVARPSQAPRLIAG